MKYILMYEGKSDVVSELTKLKELDYLNILDESLGKMILVEMAADHVIDFAFQFKSWRVVEEKTYRLRK